MKAKAIKTKYIFLQSIILCAMIISLNSCFDDKIKWGRDPLSRIQFSRIPIGFTREISRYDVLKAYLMVLGIGIDRLDYGEWTYRT